MMPDLPPAGGHGGQTRGMTAGAMPGMGAGGHGTSGGMDPGAGLGKFDRMFPPPIACPNQSDDVLLALAHLMTGVGDGDPTNPDIDIGKPLQALGPTATNPNGTPSSDVGDENPAIPAGYTYFGQFVDHDITFDPTPLHGKQIDIAGLQDYRTPALDLDSVYGSGPDNQPYMYRDEGGMKLLRTGAGIRGGVVDPHATVSRNDHFRLPPDDANNPMTTSPAVLGDKRNDENKLVAQMHGSFVALHNKLMRSPADLLQMGSFDVADPEARFRMAVKAARWHYQYVVLNDYVDRICEIGMVTEVLNAGGVPRLGHYLAQVPNFAYIPIEFAVAAYRMGHSMIRPTYALNEVVGANGFRPEKFQDRRIPIFRPNAPADEALNGFGQSIPPDWGIDWSFFFDGLAAPSPATGAPRAIPQPSYRIDATLVDPLSNLPEFAGKLPPRNANLAYRNLVRSRMDQLPSGEAVANALHITPLGFDNLWWAGSLLDHAQVPDDRKGLAKKRHDFGTTNKAALLGQTPLWYYILREAEVFGTTRVANDKPFGGQHLGPVGSRIVAETFVGLLWLDKNAFIHTSPGFKPFLGAAHAGPQYKLPDLLRYALS